MDGRYPFEETEDRETGTAEHRIAALSGTRKLAIPLAAGVAAGPAALRLTLTDRAGNQRDPPPGQRAAA